MQETEPKVGAFSLLRFTTPLCTKKMHGMNEKIVVTRYSVTLYWITLYHTITLSKWILCNYTLIKHIGCNSNLTIRYTMHTKCHTIRAVMVTIVCKILFDKSRFPMFNVIITALNAIVDSLLVCVRMSLEHLMFDFFETFAQEYFNLILILLILKFLKQVFKMFKLYLFQNLTGSVN